MKKRKISAAVLALSLILLIGAISGTAAYLFQKSGRVTNTVQAAKAPAVEILEDFDGQTKSNVRVSLSANTGEAGAYYVRAAIVITLCDDAGNVVAKIPTAADYNLVMNYENWYQNDDGYWYYKGTVKPGGTTENLINSCVPITTEYRLNVEVLAQTIQANPASAAADAWGHVPVY